MEQKVTIIGLGFVGLSLASFLSSRQVKVTGIDSNKKKIDLLRSNIPDFFEPKLEQYLKKGRKYQEFSTKINPKTINSNFIFISVGTPLDNQNGMKLDFVKCVVNSISKNLKNLTTKPSIILKSSVIPGTAVNIIKPILEKNDNKEGIHYEILSNPEFLREGDAIRDFRFPDRIVVGSNSKKIMHKLESLYEPLIKKGSIFFPTSRRGAEMIKYASNAFLATKISYINEIANLCEKIGVNVEDVSIGIGLDKRIGSRFLRAGPAYGGSCFPKDTKAITVTGDLFKTNLSIIKSVIRSNEKRKIFLTDRVQKILSNKVKNKKITFLGVTFKPNTDDMRQSSSLFMIPHLLKKGAKINYYEPSGEKKEFLKLKNVNYYNNINDACNKVDLVIIHTEWEEFKALDFKKLSNKKKFKIYDMRNLYSPEIMRRKGFNYFSIGR